MTGLTLREIAKAVGGKAMGDPEKVFDGFCTDSRKYEKGQLFIALKGEKFDANDFVPKIKDCSGCIAERVFPGMNEVLTDDALSAFGKLASYWKRKVAPEYTVGITGSVGKTTTKELTFAVLAEKYRTHHTSGNFNNGVGVPITLADTPPDTEAVVCEMGMSARGEIEALSALVRPDIAVITCIGTSHIEKLGSREEIAKAKLEIVSGLSENGVLILDGDEALLRDGYAKSAMGKIKTVFAGFGKNNDVYPENISEKGGSTGFLAVTEKGKFPVTVPAVGEHFVKDALFAIAVGVICEVPFDKIAQGLRMYVPAGMRQRIYQKNGINVIADCYNASPESMKASLSVLGRAAGKRKIAVLGDMLELGNFSETAHRETGKNFAKICADTLFTYGKEAYNIAYGASENGFPQGKVFSFTEKEELVKALSGMLCEGDTVLFKASRRMKLEEIIAGCGLSESKDE